MTGRRGWILAGLLLVAVPLVIWALLQTPAPAPGGRRGASPSGSGAGTATAAPPPVPRPRVAQIPPVEVEHTAISTVDAAGRRQWDINADTVSVDGVKGVAHLMVVRGTYFQAGKPSVTFTAPTGIFYLGSRNITLSGRVHARTTTGRTLEADQVDWFPKINQIEATGSVVLRQKGLTAYADRLVADVVLQKTNLSGHIRVVTEE